MGILKVADFYYGAFLSALLNYGGKKPSLFDNAATNSRRIYRLATSNSLNDYIFYTKYSTQGRAGKNSVSWSFPFTADEIQTVENLSKEGFCVKFAFICIQDDLKLKDCELAIVHYDQFLDCTGINKGIKAPYRINIKAIDGKRGLRMYGSGLSDKVHGQDNMLRVDRAELKNL